MKPLPTDFAEYRRRRRLARLASLVLALVLGRLLWALVVLASRDDPTRALAMVPYVPIVGLGALGGVVLGRLWRWSFAARPVVQSLDPTPGEVYGIPELDEPPRRHVGLSGDVQAPRRW